LKTNGRIRKEKYALKRRLLIPYSALSACVFALSAANGASSLESARVSQVFHDVSLLRSNAAASPASLNDEVALGMAVRTGGQSRAELTFSDLTVTRLGENTVFSLNQGTRQVQVEHGSILLEVPPRAASAKIVSGIATAAISGGTAMFGSGPPVKFMVLEGVGTFYPSGHPEEAVTLHGGEMATVSPNGQLAASKFDVKKVMQTSHLIVDFPPLANLPLISQVAEQQLATPSPPPTQDVVDVISQSTAANPTPSPPPAPTPPSEFGPPSTISSPDPYVITSGTTITTDPTSTTNGVTDFGKLYRGTTLDGFPTQFAFGEAPTAFDQMVFGGPQNNLPVAVFKFANLELDGNPTVTVPTGATTNLALVSAGDITSGPSGGTLTFSGITRLDFITQNGSINLGPEISFSGIDHLTFYARGADSNLTLASPISGGSVVHLFSEGDTNVNGNISVTGDFESLSGGHFTANGTTISANSIGIQTLNGGITIDGATLTSETLDITGGGDVNIGLNTPVTINAVTLSLSAANNLNWSGGTLSATATNSDGNVTISAGQAINITNDLDIAQTNNGQTSGLNVTLNAGTDLSVGGNLSLTTDASNIDTGGSIAVTSGGDMTIGGAFTLFIGAADGTTTGTGGNINVTSGGSLTAGSLNFDLFFDQSAQVTSGENLTLTVAKDLITTAGGVSLMISTPVGTARPPLTNGGNLSMTIGGNLTLASGGDLSLQVINSGVTEVPVGGNIFASIGGNLRANQINAAITNSNSSALGTGGNLTFSVGGNVTASSVDLEVDNFEGTITTGGNISISTSGNLTTGSGGLGVEILNSDGGSIGTGGNISITTGGNLTATSGSLIAEIINSSGGAIGSDTSIMMNAASFSTHGSFDAKIGNGGGTIGSDATIQIGTTGGVNAANLSAVIDNTGGSIGGDETINMNVGGSATVTKNATIQILGNDPTGTAAINFNGGSYNVTGTFLSTIDGTGTITFNNTNIHANVVQAGVFGTNGSLIIGGSGSNTISANTLLQLYAPGPNGLLKFVSNVTLSSGTAMDLAADTIFINNGVTVTILGKGGAANIYTNNADYSGFGGNGSTTGTFAGNGAKDPLPLSSAPTFNNSPTSSSSTISTTASNQTPSGRNASSSSKARTVASAQSTNSTISVSNSGQLLSIVNAATPGASGKITIPASNASSRSPNSSRDNPVAHAKLGGGAMSPNNSVTKPQLLTNPGAPSRIQ
jgi:hypothetical protein